MASLPQYFQRKKTKILDQLALPDAEYNDRSPKGSIDVGIRDLIGDINGRDGLVTTSSCGGRISVFLEGVRSSGDAASDGERDEGVKGGVPRPAGVGGKGGGGRWLFVSHEQVKLDQVAMSMAKFLGMEDSSEPVAGATNAPPSLIHFKFEPMILHILTGSLAHANVVLTAAHQAGFRESGALNLTTEKDPPMPMVAVRSMGLSLESIIGYNAHQTPDKSTCFVSETYLRILLDTANMRYIENAKRIDRFRKLLGELFSRFEQSKVRVKADGSLWEDAAARKERLRAEGLKRAAEANLCREVSSCSRASGREDG